jgi:hypothetical protein
MNTLIFLVLVTAKPIALPYVEPKPIAFPFTGEIKQVKSLGPPRQLHATKPTVKPRILTHTSLDVGCSDPYCDMCTGQHMRNWHGETSQNLDRVGYNNFNKYHLQLHGCPDGMCPTIQRVRVPTIRRGFRFFQ